MRVGHTCQTRGLSSVARKKDAAPKHVLTDPPYCYLVYLCTLLAQWRGFSHASRRPRHKDNQNNEVSNMGPSRFT